jgi:hypothetical protein
MIDTECVDCKCALKIDPEVPEGVDPEMPRIPICAKCAGIRLRYEAIQNQRNVEIIKRARVARHQPRITDNIDHPVTIKKQEKDMDLDNMSDAELGAIVRQQMKDAKVPTVVENKPKVEKARKQKAAAEKAEVAKEQVARKDRIFPGFEVGNLEVPTLDLSEIVSLDEAPSAVQRSPYNKARFRLTKESPLDPEETTYRTLMEEHQRLATLAQEKPVKAAKPKVEAIAVDVKPDDSAKVAALAKVLGISKKQARKMMAGV